MYTLVSTSTYDASYKKVVKGDQEKEKRTKKAIELMSKDPFYPSLKSHRVNTKNFGTKWSSWVTGDIRTIWDFDELNQQIIVLFVLAKHSGSHKQYK